MRPDLIIKNRKLNHMIGVIGIILSIIIIFLALKNLSWLYRLVGVCGIIYYLIDMEQKLEEDHVITKIVRIFMVVIDIFYIVFSMIFALAYNLIHLVVRIKVEHDGTNREL